MFKRKKALNEVKENTTNIDQNNPFNDEYPELSYCSNANCECVECEKHPSKILKTLPVSAHDYRNSVFCCKE